VQSAPGRDGTPAADGGRERRRRGPRLGYRVVAPEPAPGKNDGSSGGRTACRNPAPPPRRAATGMNDIKEPNRE